jgi:hypothetical protein
MRPNRSLLPVVVLLLACGGCTRDDAPADATTARDAVTAGTDAADGRDEGASPASPTPAPPPAPDPAGGARIDDLVRADDTLDSLRARLGTDNVRPDTLPGAEGETMSGWTLYPDDPTRRLAVYLDDTGAKPLMLLAGEGATAWSRADGVRIGLSTLELAQLNGGPFGFMGFDWDYGGVVTDWRGGRLAPDGASAGPVTLCPPDTADGAPLEDYPIGDSEFGSDDPRILMNPARVCEFGVNIDPPEPDGDDGTATPATDPGG